MSNQSWRSVVWTVETLTKSVPWWNSTQMLHSEGSKQKPLSTKSILRLIHDSAFIIKENWDRLIRKQAGKRQSRQVAVNELRFWLDLCHCANPTVQCCTQCHRSLICTAEIRDKRPYLRQFHFPSRATEEFISNALQPRLWWVWAAFGGRKLCD